MIRVLLSAIYKTCTKKHCRFVDEYVGASAFWNGFLIYSLLREKKSYVIVPFSNEIIDLLMCRFSLPNVRLELFFIDSN